MSFFFFFLQQHSADDSGENDKCFYPSNAHGDFHLPSHILKIFNSISVKKIIVICWSRENEGFQLNNQVF